MNEKIGIRNLVERALTGSSDIFYKYMNYNIYIHIYIADCGGGKNYTHHYSYMVTK